MRFKFLEHTADIKFRSYGIKLEESFSNAALAMTKSFCDGKIKVTKKKELSVKGKDLESLLYNFLEELLILFESEGFILSKVLKMKIDVKGIRLKCLVGGDSGDYEIHSHVKSVTYNEMFVKKENGKWVCQVVLDV